MLYRDHLQIIDCLINKEFIEEFGYPIVPNKKILDSKCNYYNFFTKGLNHKQNGDLENIQDYIRMVKSILKNDKESFSKISMLGKMVDPFSSNSAVVNGVMQGSLNFKPPPKINSEEASDEIIELYAQAITRDVPFVNYKSNDKINLVSDMIGKNINSLFRADLPAGFLGPYVSQFLLLNIDFDTYRTVQKYNMYLTKEQCIDIGIRNEWGVTLNEAVNIQNMKFNENPSGYPDSLLVEKFIYDGRTLARAVHKDTPYQYFYNACIILSKLKIPFNPTWPQFNNNNYFLMGTGTASMLCLIAEVTSVALYHAWYWKWQQYRKLRPEEFAIMINNVKNTGSNEYGINLKVVNSKVLDLIEDYNYEWTKTKNQFVMPLTYQEGCPLHPAYPSGHAIIAGACCTILKMIFNGDSIWTNYNQIYQADESGNLLEIYNGLDKNHVTVQSELDKLASNVAYGRNWAGIHYKSDANGGIYLGEKIAIQFMRDILSRNNFVSSIKFKGFADNEIIVEPILS